MAERKAAQKGTKTSTRRTATDKTFEGFTAEERAAMKERGKELKAEARANRGKAAGERDVLAKIAEMPQPDHAIAERLDAIVEARARPAVPKLSSKPTRVRLLMCAHAPDLERRRKKR